MKKREQSIENSVDSGKQINFFFITKRLIAILYVILTGIVIFGIGFSDYINYTYKVTLPVASVGIMLISFSILAAICILKKKIISFNVNIIYVSIALFFLQMYIMLQIYHIVNADTEIIVNCAMWVWDKPAQWFDNVNWFGQYFSAYHNNLFATIICSFLIKLESLFGIVDVNNAYVFIIMVNSLLSIGGG